MELSGDAFLHFLRFQHRRARPLPETVVQLVFRFLPIYHLLHKLKVFNQFDLLPDGKYQAVLIQTDNLMFCGSIGTMQKSNGPNELAVFEQPQTKATSPVFKAIFTGGLTEQELLAVSHAAMYQVVQSNSLALYFHTFEDYAVLVIILTLTGNHYLALKIMDRDILTPAQRQKLRLIMVATMILHYDKINVSAENMASRVKNKQGEFALRYLLKKDETIDAMCATS
jgi:hypothetical protein